MTSPLEHGPRIALVVQDAQDHHHLTMQKEKDTVGEPFQVGTPHVAKTNPVAQRRLGDGLELSLESIQDLAAEARLFAVRTTARLRQRPPQAAVV